MAWSRTNGTSLPITEAAWSRRFLLRREPVDPPGQQRLHGRRDLDRPRILDQTVGASLAGEGPGLHQGPDAFLEEERVALGALDQQALERGELGTAADQSLEQFLGALRRQGVDPELAIVGLAESSRGWYSGR